VLGEGDRDVGFLKALCVERGIERLVFDHVKGCSNFGKKLDALSANPRFSQCKAILLMGDNDESAGKSYQAIKKQLNVVDFPSPTNPLEMTRKQGMPAIAVLMLPFPHINGDPSGCLETMLIPAMETANAAQAACVDKLLACVDVASWPKKGSRDKAKVRCLISSVWQDDPMHGLPYCFSPAKNLIPLNHPIFDSVAEVLRGFPDWFNSGTKLWDDWKANPTQPTP
jgi:hypothetical protein